MHYRNHLSPPQFPTRWASSWGEDRYGPWMNLTYQDATLTFRWVMPGMFMMGSEENEEGRISWEDHHEVTIEQGFWLSDVPVTQAFWQAINGDNPSKFKGDELPVETVSWDETQQFIEKLNQLHPDLTTRLLWEAEWEYACRAGTTTAFSFGDEIDSGKANYRGVWTVKDIESYKNDKEWGSDALKKTSLIKSYPANPWGLYDMHGNVWEWCQDEWQENLGTKPTTFSASSVVLDEEAGKASKVEQNSEESDEEQGQRVMRGGSWDLEGWDCRSACRFGYAPDGRNGHVGFRLALGH